MRKLHDGLVSDVLQMEATAATSCPRQWRVLLKERLVVVGAYEWEAW